MRFPLEGQWSGREKCTLPLLRLTSAFLRKGANPSTMVSTSRTPPSRKRLRMTLRADGLRAVVLREVFFAMTTSLRLRHHHSTMTSRRAGPTNLKLRDGYHRGGVPCEQRTRRPRTTRRAAARSTSCPKNFPRRRLRGPSLSRQTRLIAGRFLLFDSLAK
jgi:hypothetical protein